MANRLVQGLDECNSHRFLFRRQDNGIEPQTLHSSRRRECFQIALYLIGTAVAHSLDLSLTLHGSAMTILFRMEMNCYLESYLVIPDQIRNVVILEELVVK